MSVNQTPWSSVAIGQMPFSRMTHTPFAGEPSARWMVPITRVLPGVIVGPGVGNGVVPGSGVASAAGCGSGVTSPDGIGTGVGASAGAVNGDALADGLALAAALAAAASAGDAAASGAGTAAAHAAKSHAPAATMAKRDFTAPCSDIGHSQRSPARLEPDRNVQWVA